MIAFESQEEALYTSCWKFNIKYKLRKSSFHARDRVVADIWKSLNDFATAKYCFDSQVTDTRCMLDCFQAKNDTGDYFSQIDDRSTFQDVKVRPQARFQ